MTKLLAVLWFIGSCFFFTASIINLIWEIKK